MEKAQRGKRKIIVSFRSELKRYRKFKKNSKKIQKIKKKNHYGFISNKNRLGNAEKEEK